MNLHGRSLLKETRPHRRRSSCYLVELGGQLRAEKRPGVERPPAGRPQHRADLREDLHPDPVGVRGRRARRGRARHLPRARTESQLGRKESMKDTARVLGRMFDGIEYRGFAQETVETLGAFAGVPVWNGLTDEWHPTQMLADILTMRDHAGKPLDRDRPTATWATAGTTRPTRCWSPARCSAWTCGSARPPSSAASRRRAGRSPRSSPPAPAPGSTVTDDVDAGRRGRRLPVHRRLAVHGRAGRRVGRSASTCCCPTR